jgi:hypothetical protein
MKVKIVIQTRDKDTGNRRTSVVWSGELDILPDTEYLAKVTMIGEGEPQPICDIPFATGIGHYVWVPPSKEMDKHSEGWHFSY